jgi:hypothetical protein
MCDLAQQCNRRSLTCGLARHLHYSGASWSRNPIAWKTMPTSNSKVVDRGPRRTRSDRRTRPHLRELCEEVLASYRVARGEEVVSREDREFANQLLSRLAPGMGR